MVGWSVGYGHCGSRGGFEEPIHEALVHSITNVNIAHIISPFKLNKSDASLSRGSHAHAPIAIALRYVPKQSWSSRQPKTTALATSA